MMEVKFQDPEITSGDPVRVQVTITAPGGALNPQPVEQDTMEATLVQVGGTGQQTVMMHLSSHQGSNYIYTFEFPQQAFVAGTSWNLRVQGAEDTEQPLKLTGDD